MHYIRLVSPPTVNASHRGSLMSLKISITTDLGDSFLSPEDPVRLCFMPDPEHITNHGTSMRPVNPSSGPAHWTAGMRVLKVDIPLQTAWTRGRLSMKIVAIRSGSQDVGLGELQQLLPWRSKEYDGKSKGLIAPLSVDVVDGQVSDVAYRPFEFDFTPGSGYTTKNLHVEEDIGESIARHIWDAGVVTTAVLADACRWKQGQHFIGNLMPITKDEINVLELGSGVGILGIGLAMILHNAAAMQGVELEQASVLLTDLPEAEERATANIKRSQTSSESMFGGATRNADLLYENLDWDDGSVGKFGPLVSSRFWDYIVLSDCTYNVDTFPVLVKTLSAIHSHNIKRLTENANTAPTSATTTKVILSTKPRHDSEIVLFDMLKEAGWTHRLLKSIPVHNLGGEDESVDVYSLEKGEGVTVEGTKKRKPVEENEALARKKMVA